MLNQTTNYNNNNNKTTRIIITGCWAESIQQNNSSNNKSNNKWETCRQTFNSNYQRCSEQNDCRVWNVSCVCLCSFFPFHIGNTHSNINECLCLVLLVTYYKFLFFEPRGDRAAASFTACFAFFLLFVESNFSWGLCTCSAMMKRWEPRQMLYSTRIFI